MAAPILIDGSNVLYWRSGQADLNALGLIIAELAARRFVPVVYFDHSIVRYETGAALEKRCEPAQIMVAPRGTPADPLLLAACNSGCIQIVSCDRYRAWRGVYPQLQKDWLVTGRIAKAGRVSFSKKLRPAPL